MAIIDLFGSTAHFSKFCPAAASKGNHIPFLDKLGRIFGVLPIDAHILPLDFLGHAGTGNAKASRRDSIQPKG